MIAGFDWVRELKAAHMAGQKQAGADPPDEVAAARYADFTAQEIAEQLAASLNRMADLATGVNDTKKWGTGPGAA